MNSDHLELFIGIITAVLASSGFWYYVNKRLDSKDLYRKLLMGLAHDRIVYLCLKYIERGEITHDEYENLCNYLYQPYKELNGNGSIEKLIEEVKRLRICKTEYFIEKSKRRLKNETLEQPI
jgi:hypothetical protein